MPLTLTDALDIRVPVSKAPTHYPALDGLRAIAFLMVFGQHYCSLPWGWTGVNVFFVLSGFLITGILWDTRESRHRARNFYIRRTLRIFPLYYGVILIVLLAEPAMRWHWSIAWVAWPLYLGNFLRFVSPAAAVEHSALQLSANAWLSSPSRGVWLFFGHFWSLCVEEQFYLFWPWIVFRVRDRRTLLWICGVVVIAVPLLRVLVQDTAPSWALQLELLYRGTPFQLDSLLLGGLLGMLWRTDHRELLLRVGRWVAIVSGGVGVAYYALTVRHAVHYGTHYLYPEWRLTWGLSFVNVLAAAVILCALRPQGWVAAVLGLRPLRWLGRISYGAYVFHDIFHSFYSIKVLEGIHKFGRRAPGLVHVLLPYHAWLTMLTALLGTLVLSWASFRYFESPFLALKERLTFREDGRIQPDSLRESAANSAD